MISLEFVVELELEEVLDLRLGVVVDDELVVKEVGLLTRVLLTLAYDQP